MDKSYLTPDFSIHKCVITEEMLNSWQPLDSAHPRDMATDCAVNVMHFLGIVEHRWRAELAAAHYNQHQQGVDQYVALERYYEQHTKEFPSTKPINVWFQFSFVQEDMEFLKTMLRMNYATYFWCNRAGAAGHSTILAINGNNEFVVIDPQQMKYYIGVAQIMEFITEQKFVDCWILFTNKREKRVDETLAAAPGKRIRKLPEDLHIRKKMRLA